jgi:hypothetical protein
VAGHLRLHPRGHLKLHLLGHLREVLLSLQVGLLAHLPEEVLQRNQIYLQLQSYLLVERHQKALLERLPQKHQLSPRDQLYLEHHQVHLPVVALLQLHLWPRHKPVVG